MRLKKSTLAVDRNHCPICQSGKRAILFSMQHDSPGFVEFIRNERFYGKAYQDAYAQGPARDLVYEIAECSYCGFFYLTEVLNDEGMGLLYNEWLDKESLREYYRTLPHIPYEERMVNLLHKHFRKIPNPRLMDFGAGYGVFCGMAVKAGFKTFAFDLSTDKNDFMDSMGVQIINSLGSYRKFFNVIWVNQVFEHVADPLGILKGLVESLADDGLMYIAVPDCSGLKQVLAAKGLSPDLFSLLSPHQHVNAFSNQTLKLLGSNAGLKAMDRSDYLSMLGLGFNPNELLLLVKKIIRNSASGTGLLFRKKTGV